MIHSFRAFRRFSLVAILVLMSVQDAAAQTTGVSTPPACLHCTIAITQIVDHPSLNAVRKGMLDVLSEQGYTPEKHHIDLSNAAGSITTAAQIAKHIESLSPNIAIAIATPSAQALLGNRNGQGFPILFSSVTDPVGAKLVKDMAHPDNNVTGVRNFPAFAENIHYLRALFPMAKRVGLVINKGESNSVMMESVLRALLLEQGITLTVATVSGSQDISTATLSLLKKIDVLFAVQDNTAASAFPSLIRICQKHHIPVIATFPEAVDQGALLAVAYDEYQIGRLTGEMAVRILRGESANHIPVADPEKPQLFVNQGVAKLFSLKIPPK